MIAGARAQLIADLPDVYFSDDFSDEGAGVERIEDLNGDGVADALVLPGSINGDRVNVAQTVYLSDAAGCATLYAGHFRAVSVAPAEDSAVTNEVRDLTVVVDADCVSWVSRYTFDGSRYVEGAVEIEDQCASLGCSSELTMIIEARVQLIRDMPEVYSHDDFSDEAARVERIGDLNGDGVEDALVLPGSRNGDRVNVAQTVYLSDATGCATLYAGHLRASSVAQAEDSAVTNGARDLTVVVDADCVSWVSRYTFDGARYVEGDCVIENVCDDDGDPMP